MKKIVNGKIIEMTAEEISQHEADVKNVEAETKAFNDAVTAKETLKTSGKNKLKALCLTDDEIKALLG